MGEKASWGWEPGEEFHPGRFVLDRLGGGTAYEVFLVWDDRLCTAVVAKVLRPDRASAERALVRLRREADALAALAHPVIVRGFGAVLEGSHPHVLLEHLEGPSLRRLLRRHGPLPVEQLLPIGLSVASALHYLEEESMVHLDVKPENVVMGVPPRLIDLSLMRSHEVAAALRGHVGTDAYMAPEQCDPGGTHGTIGAPADVWGLGATLHHALTGSVPFPRPKGARESEDPAVRFPQLVEAPGPLPRRTDPALAQLLRAMLDRNGAARPTASEVVAALEPLVAGAPFRHRLPRRGEAVR